MSFEKKFAPRRKYCRFCENPEILLDYKHPEILSDFVTDRGKIIASRITGSCAKHQRAITREIKRARQMALMFYTATHSTDVLKQSRI